MNRAIDLRLTIEPEILRVTVLNRGEQNLRLWDRHNSWGWSMFSLLLVISGSAQEREMTAKAVRWTRNVPRALDLPVGEQLDYELRHDDPSWEGLDNANAWLSQPLQVRVRLRIPETPEALEQGVFIGEAITPPCLSMPPHSWFHRPRSVF